MESELSLFPAKATNRYEDIWRSIGEFLRPQLSPDGYQRWFASMEIADADEDTLTLRAPNSIHQFWIESNYLSVLQSAVAGVLGAPRKILFTIADASSQPRSCTSAQSSEDPLPIAARAATLTPAVDLADGTVEAPIVPGLNSRYTFETFVVGPNNQFAHAAAHAVAQAPSKTYNPLFIYGGVGLGKTHLMQAVGLTIAERKRTARVVYVSSEKFTNEFIDAIQNNQLVRFRKRYRAADVLLIDDIQFLAGKERSQEEFFHTFNALFDGHKQIVLSSDRPPAEIGGLEARLVSRFEWGLTAELQPPDIETRLAILRKKAEGMQVKLDAAILEFLARKIRTNVRRLEGALMRVASFASLSSTELTLERVEHLLKDILQEEARRAVTIEQIQRAVAEHYDVRLADMTSKRRPANIAFPRQVAMYLARELTKCSLNEIGDAFGGRDHGTVLHGHRLVKKRIGEDEKLRQVVSLLDSQLQR